MKAPDAAGGWLRDKLMNLSVMYRATQAISNILDIDALSPQILELVFESIGADRGAILLKDESGRLVPKAVRWRAVAEPDERMTISQTIVDYVLEKGEGSHHHRCSDRQAVQPRAVDRRLPDPPGDLRADPGKAYHARACCTPTSRPTLPERSRPAINPTSAAASAKSSSLSWSPSATRPGLAIENTVFYNDKIQAERLAAVGQTIATLSHHIKNILQGIRGGSSLIDLGLKDKDELIVRRGWTIVEKNQTKIYNLVMDMLSFSKDREPDLELADLNETIGDVFELMQSRAAELGVALDWQPSAVLPRVMIDTEGIHRAVLNIVTNAIDACEGSQNARVSIKTEWDAETPLARISISDNGVGIEEAEIPSIFQLFASTKGSRGTGLGLPVTQKIIREHGGKISVTSRTGPGLDLRDRAAGDQARRPKGDFGRATRSVESMRLSGHCVRGLLAVRLLVQRTSSSISFARGPGLSACRFPELLKTPRRRADDEKSVAHAIGQAQLFEHQP